MHNLKIDFFEEQLDADKAAKIIDEIACKVCDKGMETAAVLFLEMHKPLAFFAGQSLMVATPILAPIFGINSVNKYSQIFGSRIYVEQLIKRIETISDEKMTSKVKAEKRSHNET